MSTIETFRKRYHKASTLRLLSISDDGQKLMLVREISKGFFIGRNFDTMSGAYALELTIDILYNPATPADIINSSFVDLVTSLSDYQRFRIDTNTPPLRTNTRYVAQIKAEFANQLPIDGVIVYYSKAPAIVLADASPVVINPSRGQHFELATAVDRLLGAPGISAYDMQQMIVRWTNTGINPITITVTTAGAGAFRLAQGILIAPTLPGKSDYFTAVYNALDQRWDIVGYISG